MQEIDELTIEGYEELAKEAKENGTSSAEFVKQLVAAQKQKAKDYLKNRATETQPAQGVTGGGPGEQAKDDSKDEIDRAAKEIAEMAKDFGSVGSEMY